jgi:hypothetical protein
MKSVCITGITAPICYEYVIPAENIRIGIESNTFHQFIVRNRSRMALKQNWHREEYVPA